MKAKNKMAPMLKLFLKDLPKKFKLQIGEVSAVCTLVAKPAGKLLANEFRIEINGGNVSKITNRSYTINGKKTKISE